MEISLLILKSHHNAANENNVKKTPEWHFLWTQKWHQSLASIILLFFSFLIVSFSSACVIRLKLWRVPAGTAGLGKHLCGKRLKPPWHKGKPPRTDLWVDEGNHLPPEGGVTTSWKPDGPPSMVTERTTSLKGFPEPEWREWSTRHTMTPILPLFGSIAQDSSSRTDRQNWRSLNSFWGSSSQCVPLAPSHFSAFFFLSL